MLDTMTGWVRTHSCNDLRADHQGQEVILCGWAARRRDHGGLIFVDLRDRSGMVQLVFAPEVGEEAFRKAETVRSEFVLAIKGEVRSRDAATVNSNMDTGAVEVF